MPHVFKLSFCFLLLPLPCAVLLPSALVQSTNSQTLYWIMEYITLSFLLLLLVIALWQTLLSGEQQRKRGSGIHSALAFYSWARMQQKYFRDVFYDCDNPLDFHFKAVRWPPMWFSMGETWDLTGVAFCSQQKLATLMHTNMFLWAYWWSINKQYGNLLFKISLYRAMRSQKLHRIPFFNTWITVR